MISAALGVQAFRRCPWGNNTFGGVGGAMTIGEALFWLQRRGCVRNSNLNRSEPFNRPKGVMAGLGSGVLTVESRSWQVGWWHELFG